MRFYDVTYFDFYILLYFNVCGVLFSFILIRICNTYIANWEFVETSRKYLYNAWLLSRFNVGVGDSHVSRGNLNSLPTSETLCSTSLLSIGDLFHTYWDVFAFRINTIACVFFSNWWWSSTLFPLLLPCDRGHNVILMNLHIFQKRLWIGCLNLLLPLLPCQMITKILP